MSPQPWPLPLWIGHRGAGKLAPENTLAAFRVGASHGLQAFECDVKISADGVPFLLHDTTLERTTAAHGVAGERPWSELSRIDAGSWHSPAFAGEPLPALEAIARYVQANGFALNLELKPTPGHEQATGAAVGAACLRLWQGSTAPLLFSSFKPDALLGARDAAPEIARALLIDTVAEGWLHTAQSLGCVAVVSNFKLVDAPLAAQVHGAGMQLLCYTVNDADVASRLAALRVVGIITDAVDALGPGGARTLIDEDEGSEPPPQMA